MAYQIHEFAKLTGLTVRALQHYDHLGLLTPVRSRAGHRTYSDQDLEELVQILALKAVGVPLRQIASLRRSGAPGLVGALRMQRAVLEKRKPLIDRAITAIRNVELAIEDGRHADPSALKSLIEAMSPPEDMPQGQVAPSHAAAAAQPKAPDRAELRRQWQSLLADVERASSQDPSSPESQALADRWIRLLESLAGSAAAIDAQLVKSVGVLGSGGPGRGRPGLTPAERAWEFVGRALATRAGGSAGGSNAEVA
jgi:DNA-binding transcriptional MerR regulator